MDYEGGLTRMAQAGFGSVPAFVMLADALRKNLAQERRYGSTEELRGQRAKLVNLLNRLALFTGDVSFNEYCQGRS